MDKEKELLMNKTYRQFINAGLGLDSSISLNDIVDDKLMGFGTTIDEKILNISELKDLLARQKEQSKDIDLRWEIKPISHYTSADENTAFFADEIFLYAKVDSESIEMYLRFSVVLSYVNDQWKVIHWHGSKPENVQSEEDTFGIENWKQKAEALEKLVEERTADLVVKNRELEVETSLEKVRAQGLGMYKPDDLLNVCRVLFKELSLLGFSDIRNAIIHTFNDEEEYFIDYDYSDLTGGFITNIPYNAHSVVKRFLKQIRSSDEAFAEITVKGKELNEWKKFRKDGGQPDDPRLDKISALYYYFHSVGTGDIGISTFSSINEEKLQILKRFRNVFDLAYKRYTDIIKAEAQAREAQIELALEKVRARTMAMQKSDELRDAVLVIYQQLQELDFGSQACNIIIIDKDTGEEHFWVSGFTQEIFPESYHVPRLNHHYQEEQFSAWRNGVKYAVFEYTGKEKKSFDKIFFTQTDFRNIPEQAKEFMIGLKSIKLSTAFTTYGSLQVLGPEPLSEEKATILERFAKVFEQTYTRFLDLQKAEAQAREAQIETGLERVRSKTMAMHRSEEVTGIAVSLNEELLKLGFEGGSTIIIIDKESGDTEQWTGFSEDKTLKSCYVPCFKHPCHDALLDFWKKGEKFFVYTLTGEEKKTFDEHYFTTGYKDFPESDKKWMRHMGSVTFSYAFMKYGAIHWGPDHLTEEQLKILQRFSKVFEQSYTRFLDLQKAEAQAREAQIETALERVRARTMGMHQSKELHDVIREVYNQLRVLQFRFDGVDFMTDYSEKGFKLWLAAQEHSFPESIYVPAIDNKIFHLLKEVHRQGKDFFTFQLVQKEKDEYFKHLFKNTVIKNIPEAIKQQTLNAKGMATSCVVLKNIILSATNLDSVPYTDEENAIIKRFAFVFEQSYTRFLDLQKAEAQAKEARIEAALERVRSRSMAMHKSDDLHEVIKVVTEQLSVLDLKFNVANFAKINQDGSWDLWLSTPEQAYPALIHVPYLDHPIFNRLTEEEAKGNDFYTDVYTREQTNIFFHHFFENTIARNTPEERKQFVYSSEGLTRSVFQTKNIWFSVARYNITAFTDEENAIFKRFANVFEQAYTRFLDLQKAEAQAREADIELSLERVRAKTMAMQKPSEFVDVINEIGEQFVHLDFDIEWVNFGANGLEISKGIDIWNFAVIPGSPPISARVFIPYFDHPLFIKAVEELDKYRRTGNDLFIMDLSKDDKDRWLDHLFTKTIFKDVPEEYRAIQYAKPGYTTSNIALKDTWFSIGKFDPRSFTDEQHSILRRFAKAFGQAYTRFLDLQKAEAQAREAQIEASLERVRSRAMAMQNSDELKELIGTVFTELTKLDIVLTRCLIMIYDPRSNDSIWWMANSEAPTEPIGLRIQNHDHPPYAAYLKAWQEKKLNWVYVLDGAIKKDWDDFLFVETELSHLPDFVIAGMKAPERVYLNSSFNSFGNLTLATLEPLSNEHFDILLRFAKVFDLTYTRFNDLKQAEAQKREAQIELALERVRARTMAMHKSEELAETAQVLFQQLSDLGGIPDRIAIGIADETNGVVNFWTTDQQGSHLEHSFSARLNERTTIAKTYQAWKEQKKSLVVDLHGQELNEWIQFAREEMGIAVKGDQIKDRRVHSLAFFSHGWILVTSHVPQSSETIQILERFASVFNLTYRRFLDLQKAEAQAKEAQIETALEKIRSRSLAMHQSDELQEVITTVFDRFQELNIEAATASIMIMNNDNTIAETWIQNAERTYTTAIHIPFFEQNMISRDFTDALINKKDLLTKRYSRAEKNVWFNLLFDATEMGYIPVERKQHVLDGDCYYVSIVTTQHGGIHLGRYVDIPFTDEENTILRRFAKVFEQAYIRFLDLKKAEAQTREAQIETSLERVRSKTMAMHNSQDVGDTVATMLDELVKLGIETVRCGIAIIDESKTMEVWTASPKEDGSVKLIIGQLDMRNHPLFMQVYDAWKKKKTVTTYELIGDDLKNYFRNINNSPNYSIRYDIESLPYRQSNTAFIFPEGCLFVFSQEPLILETTQIFKRFAGVFGQTYRRYLDLLKAEANAREAQIEAGLERVRARTMAMHSSDDVSVATATMFTELEKLGIQNLRGGITIIKPDQTQEVWSVTNLPDGKTIRSIGVFDMRLHPFWQEIFKAFEKNEDYQYYWLAGKDKEDYIAILNATLNYLVQPIKEFPDVHVQSYFFGEGGIWTNSLQPHSEEDKQVMKKFASVFSLTFRRYQDLKKAEAQAREATIEAALERVRGKAMAMHSSKDLATTIGVFYHELEGLNLTPRRCGVGLIDKETMAAEISTMNASADGHGIELVGILDLRSHPVLTGVYNNWLTKTEYHPVLRGNEIKEYYQVVRPQIDFPDYPNDTVQYGYFFFFEEGGVYAWTEKELSEEELKIYRRFTSVLSLTYKRYKDLKNAEARTQAAIKDAALDRIRADIASMRTINDLDRITPLIWNELTVLGIPFIRCGVFIMDEEQELIHTFLSTPDGKAIAAFHLAYNTPGNINHVLANWKVNKNYIDRWEESEFKQFGDILVKQGTLASAEQYLKTIPHGGFHLHFLPFLQGMLYVGNTTQLGKEEIELIQHVADAFSTAYARYEDFNKLEAAKQQVENTLKDLKQAQTQLVQSEKMASLGEMTAGIAHEIQNPLNFVNNFSEVSKELLDEMKTELETGNTEDAKDIADDVIQNLEKINHHGKRADAIVKSMLQHSRSNSGKKEPTDINALADEYLRLAYHGLRAKDKSFNAKFETEFDSSIGKINIISQDIGRVLVNLINNAFYAAPLPPEGGFKDPDHKHIPTVWVSTKKIADKVLISVKDNGPGISQKVLDKIFQPFFTTKPTGQGTGLGLSLAYDIVTKGHNGELKVETKEGEGSEFIIQLPVSKSTES